MLRFTFTTFTPVKEQLHIKQIISALSLAGLALLLLLSPCKIRNFIQSELGVSQTRALNKSQSTISQYSCFAFEITESAETVTESTLATSYLLYPESYSLDYSNQNHKDPIISHPLEYLSTSDVPLYILYKSLKIYS